MPYNPNFLSKLAEGNITKVETQIKSLVEDPLPVFRRMFILDVIYDPKIIDDNKINYWKNVLKVSNSQYAKILPRNSVVAQMANIGNTRITPVMFLFPFFPSHLALPCKPGEMVWAMFENPNSKIKEMGYWFCRITEPHFVDDINHTHHPMQLDESLRSSTKKKVQETDEPIYELRNGKTEKRKNGIRSTIKESRLLETNDEEVFEKLVTDTDAARLMQYEGVPRFSKRPGDIAIEGSNNTLIVLGTDRVNKAGDYSPGSSQPNRGIIAEISDHDLVGHAGSIDLVTGRGMKVLTGGLTAVTTKISDGEELKSELDKKEENLVEDEGNPDFKNDRSRILISQRTNVDKNFNLNNYLENKFPNSKIVDNSSDSAIVIKSDKVRIIARSDVSLIVKNYEEVEKENKQGSYKEEMSDDKFWASITITRNGDVIFTPSEKGYIKLGGEDADRAIVCTANKAKQSDGKVSSLPIASTAGGFIGTTGGNTDNAAVGLSAAPDLGTFSTKVLIK